MLAQAALQPGWRIDLLTPQDLLSMPDWDLLVAEAVEPNAFLEPWFLKPAITHLELEPGACFAVLRDEAGDLVGLIGLALHGTYARMPISHVCNHIHSTFFLDAPLIRQGYERIFWSKLLSMLDETGWAKGLLLLRGLVDGGAVLAALNAETAVAGRTCDTVYAYERALLQSDLASGLYFEGLVRKKKRKEINRLRNRLTEIGEVRFDWLADATQAPDWSAQFLALEQSGWKGESGSALGAEADKSAFFSDMIQAGMAAGRVEMLRLSLDSKPLAMLVNFMGDAGSFSFKIAYDEAFARYSPGVLIEIENLKLLDRPGFGWMDSCAAPDHPMINSLWGERRTIIWKAVALKGARRTAIFRTARLVEDSWAAFKRFRTRKDRAMNDNRTQDDD